MKVSITKLSQSQIELRVEIPFEEFEKFIERAILDLGKDLEIPGFRKGKAPREIIEREIGQAKILKTAAQFAIQENYPKAIRQLADKDKIEAISSPQVEILKLAPGNPLEFKAKTWILPEIELPDYKKIASQVKKREVKVTKEEIEKLKQEKERWEKERLRGEILEKIAERTKVEIPKILIEQEQKRMLENLKSTVLQALQISFEDYLTKVKKTEKELSESFLPESEKRVKISLVSRGIGKKEKISVTPQEIEEEIKKAKKERPGLERLDQEQLKKYTKEALKNEKTLQYLEDFIQQ